MDHKLQTEKKWFHERAISKYLNKSLYLSCSLNNGLEQFTILSAFQSFLDTVLSQEFTCTTHNISSTITIKHVLFLWIIEWIWGYNFWSHTFSSMNSGLGHWIFLEINASIAFSSLSELYNMTHWIITIYS